MAKRWRALHKRKQRRDRDQTWCFIPPWRYDDDYVSDYEEYPDDYDYDEPDGWGEDEPDGWDEDEPETWDY